MWVNASPLPQGLKSSPPERPAAPGAPHMALCAGHTTQPSGVPGGRPSRWDSEHGIGLPLQLHSPPAGPRWLFLKGLVADRGRAHRHQEVLSRGCQRASSACREDTGLSVCGGVRGAVFHLTQGHELLPLLRVWGAECIQKGRNINISTNVAVLVQMDPAGLSSLMSKSLACP